MYKRFVSVLLLALALCGGPALAVASQMDMGEADILYDGTYLSIAVPFTSPDEGVALVDSALLDPNTAETQDLEEARATGATLMGVWAGVELQAANEPYNAPNVFFERQEGRALTRGFIYALDPDVQRDGLVINVSAELCDKPGGPSLAQAKEAITLPRPVEAEVVTFDTELALTDLLPWYGAEMRPEGEVAPDWSVVEAVSVSSSQLALVVQMRLNGDAAYSLVSCKDAATGTALGDQFSLNNVNTDEADVRWISYVLDPVDTLPDALDLTFERPANDTTQLTLRLDLQAQTLTVL